MKSLNDIPKSENFRTPEGYFDRLTERIESRIEGRVSESSPLQQISKESVFKTPDAYFDQLPLRIQQRLEKKKSAASWMMPWSWSPALKLAVATLVIGFGAWFYFQPGEPGSNLEAQLTEVASEHLLAFLEDSDVNEAEVLEAAGFSVGEADSLNLHISNSFILTETNEQELKNTLDNEL